MNTNCFLLLFLSIFLFQNLKGQDSMNVSDKSVYDFSMTTIDGQEKSLEDYKGKVLLIVNVASKCGLTPQYEDLQALYVSHQEKGLEILGFPANNFMGQEPGSNEEIQTFCKKNYGVSFQMFSKISVKQDSVHPLYQYLKEVTGTEPQWNFHKYLVSRDGSKVVSIDPRTKVNEEEVMKMIEEML